MLQELQDALSAAFDLPKLQRMVKFKLGRELDDFGGMHSNKQIVVFNLITDADREGFLEKLVIGAREFNPGNATLHAFARDFGLESTRRSRQELERIIDETHPNLSPTDFRQKIFEAEMRVCRLEIPTGQGLAKGTGFLVAQDIVLTNRHVVESLIDQGADAGAALARFDYKATAAKTIQEGTVVRFAQDWLVDNSDEGPYGDDTLPRTDELDYALVRLTGEPPRVGDTARGFYQIPGQHPKFAADAPLFIMQHPSGRPLELALDTKAVIGENDNGTRIRYRTNTERGSSGSPCFTPAFELVALHHSGDPDFDPAHKPTYNEGIPMRAIAALLKQRGKAAAVGL